MAEFKMIQEFGQNGAIFTLEPAVKCVCHCTWCYRELNRRKQAAGKERVYEASSTFESTIQKAFGPEYDPMNFLQWGLKNHLIVTTAAGVEPFQDLGLSRAILPIVKQFEIPLFIQTRGTNFKEVLPLLEGIKDNIEFYVSLPSLNQKYVSRFEPGSPTVEYRIDMIRTMCSMGVPVTLAIAPYHPEWSGNINEMIEQAIGWGINDIFLDVLHLNRRQLETATDQVMVKLEKTLCPVATINAWRDARNLCYDAGIGFYTFWREAIVNELYSFTSKRDVKLKNRMDWDYHDQVFKNFLEYEFGEEESTPIAFTFKDALSVMEMRNPITQRFSFAPIRNSVMDISKLPGTWKDILTPDASLPDFFRAMWNNPSKSGFAWSHPFARIAMMPDGNPYLDDEGNIIMVYDPDYSKKSLERTIEDIEDCRYIEY